MIGGMVGALLTGLFATTIINEAAADGLFYGNPAQFGKQAIAVAATLVYSLIATFIILFITDKLVGLRVTEDDELLGLDLSQHSETGYSMAEGGAAASRPPAGHSSDE
jgi:Amt family ammonium transporter